MWTAFASILGTALGGFISFYTQRSVRSAADKAELARIANEHAKERRSEQLAHCVDFLVAIQEAERAAVDRYHHKTADGQWQARAKQAIDRMWIVQKTIHMVCPPEINVAARLVAFAVRDVVRNGPADHGDPQDEKVWEAISPSRRNFLDVVRDHLQ